MQSQVQKLVMKVSKIQTEVNIEQSVTNLILFDREKYKLGFDKDFLS